jgi:hypothetical protein
MTDCVFQSDVLDAVASRRWPARTGDDLLAHVATCSACRDLAAVAQALAAEDEMACAGSRVPSSAVVWHRAQLRVRADMTRAAMRPLGFAHGVAFALGMAGAMAVAVWALPLLVSFLPDFSAVGSALSAAVRLRPELDLETVAVLSHTSVQIVLAAAALAAPLALYLTLRDSSS